MSGSRGTARHPARLAAAVAASAALVLSACGSSDDGDGGGDATGGGGEDGGPDLELPDLTGESLEIAAVWTGAERDTFMAAVEDFADETGAEVSFVPTGDNIATFVGQKIDGGAPPDIAILPQVGVFHEFAEQGWAAPLGDAARTQVEENFSDGWQELGAWEDEAYGVYVKAANKSLIWYNDTAFQNAGVEPVENWDELIEIAEVVSDSGVSPMSVAGADGWTLTDWFENIYLSQAGPDMYDQLAAHEIPWTHESVTEALETLGELFGEERLLTDGTAGALRTDFPTSVSQVFSDTDAPTSAMVYEADFTAAVINDSTDAVVGEDALVFPFPAVGDEPPVVTGGDVAVAVQPDGDDATEAQDALMAFLASTDAARTWVEPGGLISPNQNLHLDAYPDETQRDMAEALIEAGDDFRFDLSDQAPAAFGGTTGRGMWQGLQDFLRDPDDVEGVQEYLEDQAAAAYGTD